MQLMNNYGIKQVISRIQLESEAVIVMMILKILIHAYPCEHVHMQHTQILEAHGGRVDREDTLNKF